LSIVPLLALLGAALSLLLGSLYWLYYYGYLGRSVTQAKRRRLEYLALHEAGHAVIAWHMPVVASVESASVIPDPERTESAGRVCVHYRVPRPLIAYYQQSVLLLLAGMASESALGHSGIRGAHDRDRHEVNQHLIRLSRLLNQPHQTLALQSWALTLALVKDHARAIRRVQRALVRKGVLDKADLLRLLGPRPAYSEPG
jgi:hypothetical protein